MSVAIRRRRRRARRVVFAVSSGLFACILGACIVADPLPDQRSLPTRSPSIAFADPPASTLLVALPDRFNVTVRLYNPTIPFQWRLFLDYDPSLNPNQVIVFGPVAGTTPSLADLQTVPVPLGTYPIDPNACHRFEFLAALDFAATPPHAAGSEGAASVTWFYVPLGDYSKCSPYDGGGSDGAFFDAGSDAPLEAASQ